MLVKKHTPATTAYEKTMGKNLPFCARHLPLHIYWGRKPANHGILSLSRFLSIFTPFNTDEAKHDG